MRDDFAVFVLTYGRPDNQRTLRALDGSNYTGRRYLVCSDDDPALPEYQKRYGDQVVVFSKDDVAAWCDEVDQGRDRATILYARNATFGIAEQLGVRYFMQLDDDYTNFAYRWVGKKPDQRVAYFHEWTIRNLDGVLEALLRFYESTPTDSLALSQGGDHFGGAQGNTAIRMKRKAMNTWICSPERSFDFIGTLNDDVNTYLVHGAVGRLFLSYMPLRITHPPTQQSSGGISETYLKLGTYAKSFYSVIVAPSCVTIKTMGQTDRRLHHFVSWNNAAPKIVSEAHRRTA